MTANILPSVPMPPTHGGPFDGIPIGPPLHNDDFHQSGPQDHFGHNVSNSPGFFNYDADSDGAKGKKGKKTKIGQNRPPIEVLHEGYVLEKAEPLHGENPSWARVGKRTLPWDEKKLKEITKAHRQKTRQSPQRDFEQLSSNQQGIVTRLIDERKLSEKNKNAEWILADVQRIGKWSWTSMEVRKIQVILQRRDKHQPKINDKSSNRETKTYQAGEILDLEDPINKKKGKGNKGVRQSRSLDELNVLGDRGTGMGFGPPPPPPGNHFPPQMPMNDHFNGPTNGPPPSGPPGNINMSFEQRGPPQFMPPPQPLPLTRRQSERPPQLGNPFEPNAQFNRAWPI